MLNMQHRIQVMLLVGCCLTWDSTERL